MSEERIINPHISDVNLAPKMINEHYNFREVKFRGICLKQGSVSFPQENIVNLYTTYELDIQSKDFNTDFTLGNCLFGAVKLTKNADSDKYKCGSYGIGFDSLSEFSWINEGVGKNVIIFGVDNSFSVHIDS